MPEYSRTCRDRHCRRAGKALSQQNPLQNVIHSWVLVGDRGGCGFCLPTIWFPSSIFTFLWRLPPSSLGSLGVVTMWISSPHPPTGWVCDTEWPIQVHPPQHSSSLRDRHKTQHLGAPSEKEAEQGRLMTSLDHCIQLCSWSGPNSIVSFCFCKFKLDFGNLQPTKS